MLICKGCNKPINPLDPECGYFIERDGSIYCEKCYAEKRWKEVDDRTKNEWIRNVLNCFPELSIFKEIRTEENEKEVKTVESFQMATDFDVIELYRVEKTKDKETGNERIRVRCIMLDHFDEREWKKAVARAMRKIPTAMHGLVADDNVREWVVKKWKERGWKYGNYE